MFVAVGIGGGHDSSDEKRLWLGEVLMVIQMIHQAILCRVYPLRKENKKREQNL